MAGSIGLFDDFSVLNEHPNDQDKEAKSQLRACRNLARFVFMNQSGHDVAFDEYISALDQAFAQNAINQAHLIIELLNTRGSLLSDQVRALPQTFAQSPAVYHPFLLQRVCQWLATDDPVAVQTHLLAAIREGITELAQQPIVKANSIGPEVFILFSFAYWAFIPEPLTVAQSVFLTGLKLLYAQGNSAQPARLIELLTYAEPLFAVVPPRFIQDALLQGVTSHDAAIRQISRLLIYFVDR